MKQVQHRSKLYPIKERALLTEALLWIAARIPPTTEQFSTLLESENNNVDESAITEAKHSLHFELLRGNLKATGIPFLRAIPLNEARSDEDFEISFDSRRVLKKEIWREEVSFLNNVIWEGGRLASLKGFSEIEIETIDLLKLWPEKAQLKSSAGESKQPIERENALHTELLERFEKWGKPKSNKTCWDLLAKIDFNEVESVIQEVVKKPNPLKSYINWCSPTGNEAKIDSKNI